MGVQAEGTQPPSLSFQSPRVLIERVVQRNRGPSPTFSRLFPSPRLSRLSLLTPGPQVLAPEMVIASCQGACRDAGKYRRHGSS